MTDRATRVYRALLVDAYTDASWHEYIRATSRADDGTDPVNEHANHSQHDTQSREQSTASPAKHRAQ